MKVKYNNSESSIRDLIGGAPQGTILGGIKYNIASSDCAVEEITPEDRFRYYDDLNALELILLSDLLCKYDFEGHVPSDVATDQLFLKPENLKMQSYLDTISEWTKQNHMLLNEEKSFHNLFKE